MIDNLLNKYSDFMSSSLSFVPSENIIPGYILNSIPNEIYNRYYFDSIQGIEFFPGSKYLRDIIKYVEHKLKSNLGVKYVNISAISGVNLMTVVISGLLTIGEGIYIVPSNKGGHFITKELARKFGINIFEIPFLENGEINQSKMVEDSIKNNIKLVYIDQMSGNYHYNFKYLKSKLGSKITTYYDVSHNMAFCFSSYRLSLLKEGFDAFGGSTHKTFPGGHKAIFCTNNESIFIRINDSSKIFVSHIHMYDLAILGKVLEYMDNKWDNYISKINKINKSMRVLFKKLGFNFLDFNAELNHQLLIYNDSIDLGDLNKKLSDNGIIFNHLWINKKPVLRIGFQEFALLNPSEKDIQEIIKYIYFIYINKKIDRKKLQILKNNLKNNLINNV